MTPSFRYLPAAITCIAMLAPACATNRYAVGGREGPEPEIPIRSPQSPALPILEQFRKSAGVEFMECPDLDCLRNALRTRRSSHFAQAFFTTEGTAAFLDYFVVPNGRTQDGRHEVVVIGDYSADYWGRCSVKKRVCPDIESATSNTPGEQGCSPVAEVLLKLEPCEYPRDR